MKTEQIKISYVGTKDDRDRAQAELEDEWNSMFRHANKGRADDADMAYEYSADPTDSAIKNLARIKELQDMLRDWQDRWPSEHTEADCDGECERDHDEEARESAAETAWEIERDVA